METKIIEINPKELKLLELNARYMRHEEFKRLVDNIKRDGKLTSVPFAWLDPEDNKYLVLSGNHRVMASIDAGLEKINVMVTHDKLTKQQRIAIQLSHNAITGQDDPAILKELYEQIIDVDMKIYSGLDDDTLGLLEKVQPMSLSEANLAFQTLSIAFLPNELEEAKEVLDEAIKLAKADETWLARYSEYDDWLDSVEIAGSAAGIRNNATAIKIMLDVFKNNITDLAELYKDDNRKTGEWVPIAPIFGTNNIPIKVAQILMKAIDKMLSRQEITKKNIWQALEYWAADYLAGE
jgi:hypothetical protein